MVKCSFYSGNCYLLVIILAHRSFRKVVKESDLDYQSAMKRDRDLESDGEAEEDEYKLDKPSAFNKLFGLLKKSSKRQEEWKKRKLEEEGLEDLEDEDNAEVEEEGENDCLLRLGVPYLGYSQPRMHDLTRILLYLLIMHSRHFD